jgi:hypothetical protein
VGYVGLWASPAFSLINDLTLLSSRFLCFDKRENADAQAASTDGRATLYANGQTHMFERKKGVIKKQREGFKYKKTKPSIFSFPT